MTAVLDIPVKRCRPSEDVIPFSECRQNFSAVINRPRETHRPILITQNGRATSYLVDAADFDDLIDRIELSHSVAISRQQFENGEFLPHDEVMSKMQKMLDEMKSRGEIA